jgi:subtilisin family serine protease
MKKQILSSLLLVCCSLTFAQTTNYWIVFKDKNNTPYSLDRPSEFLSERSLLRRQQQHVSLNERDLPVNPAYIKELQDKGAIIKNRSKWYNAVTVSVSSNADLNAISALPYVKSITKIEIIPSANSAAKFDLETASVPEAKALRESAVSYNYGPSYNQAAMIGADCMHGWGYSGQGIVIAVLDAGFYNANILPAFDSLRTNNQILGCRDIVTGDTLVYEDYSHGMNVLSCMGGYLPARIVGTAPKANYWLLRTEDAGSESLQEEINWLIGAEFADSVGADIINSSLGYSRFDDSTTNHTYADMDGNSTIVTNAADWAASVGIFVVSSAGNSGGPTWYKITAPADGDSVLTVGAVNFSGVIASFSSRGPTFDGRIKPNVVAQGVGAAIAANEGDITFANGTSFSSPIIAGAVACLKQANPGRTNYDLMDAIYRSSSQYGSPDSIKGYGIPDFCWANFILAGINEDQAIEETLNVYPNPFNTFPEVSFYSSSNQDINVSILDITGRSVAIQEKTVQTNTTTRFGLDVAGSLSAGIYILQIRSENRIFTKKLIKE